MSIRTLGSSVEQAPQPAPAAAESTQASQKPAPAAEARPSDAPQASAEQVRSAVAEIERIVQMSARNLQFSIDDDSGKTIVSVIDKNTGDLVRQIPSKELMEIAKSVGRMQGLLVNGKA